MAKVPGNRQFAGDEAWACKVFNLSTKNSNRENAYTHVFLI